MEETNTTAQIKDLCDAGISIFIQKHTGTEYTNSQGGIWRASTTLFGLNEDDKEHYNQNTALGSTLQEAVEKLWKKKVKNSIQTTSIG